jgi:hypothetical protein
MPGCWAEKTTESCPKDFKSEQIPLAFKVIYIYTFSIINQGEIMSSRMFSAEQKLKLTQIINEGVSVLEEIENLNAGLNDTVKAIAEELEIKTSVLKKAIRIAQKSKLTESNADHEELNTILETVGKTL